MASSQAHHTTLRPIRLWPGVVAVVVQWIFWFAVPLAAPDYAVVGLIGGIAGAVAVLVWWLFFSRAPWSDRLGALLVVVASVLAVAQIVHLSISNGMMGRMSFVFATPFWCLGLVAAAAIGRGLSAGARRAVMVVSILLACGGLTLVRTGGVSGAGGSDLHWRWTPTPEERLLAQSPQLPAPPNRAPGGAAATSPPAAPASPAVPVPAAVEKTPDKPAVSKTPDVRPTAAAAPMEKVPDLPGEAAAQWPGFRGTGRDNVVRGVRLETDWSDKPPVELWRRQIGPGWSSFAVSGDFIYTQEQRGDHELVSCYKLSTGEPVWTHRDAVRFYESNGGAGPRGTPAVHQGRVYALGATGIVNALDARTGASVWSRNAKDDTGAPLPGWGFAASPLIVGDVVIVAASGRLVGYEIATGKPRWTRVTLGGGYSSPHLVTTDGVTQILMLSGGGVVGVAPADGTLLWEHRWQMGVGIVQPALASDGDVLIAGGDMMGGVGVRRLALARDSSGWKAEERWTSRGLKPFFNDFVVHEGHAYGFDGTILSCINLDDGERKWKGGRYGAGQMLLVGDQDLLLVLSEEGEVVLVTAAPDKHTEVARFKAIEGKTWNHPVLVGNLLLVRNGEEMAAFRLATEGR